MTVPAGVDAVAAIAALANHCGQLWSLTVREGSGGNGGGNGGGGGGNGSGGGWEAIVRELVEAPRRGKGGGPALPPLASRLRRINLSGCSVADSHLAALAPSCPSLLVLRLVGCAGVGARGVEAVGGGCAALRRLVVAVEEAARLGEAASAALPPACELILLSSAQAAAAQGADHASEHASDADVLGWAELESNRVATAAGERRHSWSSELDSISVEVRGDEGSKRRMALGGCCALQ